jgi:hypothetical protein
VTYFDYIAFTSNGSVVFQPVTPRAHPAFKGLPLDAQGCFTASSDDEANALFARLDEADLVDFTAG